MRSRLYRLRRRRLARLPRRHAGSVSGVRPGTGGVTTVFRPWYAICGYANRPTLCDVCGHDGASAGDWFANRVSASHGLGV